MQLNITYKRGERFMMKVKAPCPCCKNGRLFDCVEGSLGSIFIKCPRCKQEVLIDLAKVHEAV